MAFDGRGENVSLALEKKRERDPNAKRFLDLMAEIYWSCMRGR